MAKIDNLTLEVTRESLERTFDCQVAIKPEVTNLDYAHDPKRRQYVSSRILDSLRQSSRQPGERVLGIVDVDLYAPGLNFVFGEADIVAGVAVISLCRLKPERYGLPPNENLFLVRAIKEAVHELGHTYHLSHCPNVRCVMHFSNSLADTDIKEASFCPKCWQRLTETRTGARATGSS